MVFWGLVLAIAGALTVLVSFLSSLNIFSDMAKYGFGTWIARFFTPEFLTGKKIAFFVAVILLILGVVLFFVGRKKGGSAKSDKSMKFLRDLKGEFKKVTWPTFPAVVRNTGVTLALCAILGVVICLIDLGLGQLVQLMLKLG